MITVSDLFNSTYDFSTNFEYPVDKIIKEIKRNGKIRTTSIDYISSYRDNKTTKKK